MVLEEAQTMCPSPQSSSSETPLADTAVLHALSPNTPVAEDSPVRRLMFLDTSDLGDPPMETQPHDQSIQAACADHRQEEMSQFMELLQEFVLVEIEREVSQMKAQFERIEKDLQVKMREVLLVEMQRERLPFMSEIISLKQELEKLDISSSREGVGQLNSDAVFLTMQIGRQDLRIAQLEQLVKNMPGSRTATTPFSIPRHMEVPTTPPVPCTPGPMGPHPASAKVAMPHTPCDGASCARAQCGEWHATFNGCTEVGEPEEELVFIQDVQSFTDRYAEQPLPRPSSSCIPERATSTDA